MRVASAFAAFHWLADASRAAQWASAHAAWLVVIVVLVEVLVEAGLPIAAHGSEGGYRACALDLERVHPFRVFEGALLTNPDTAAFAQLESCARIALLSQHGLDHGHGAGLVQALLLEGRLHACFRVLWVGVVALTWALLLTRVAEAHLGESIMLPDLVLHLLVE